MQKTAYEMRISDWSSDVCSSDLGPPPPSSGPLAVLQMLGILQHFPMGRLGPQSVEAVHYFSEAGRLAFADRGFYVADPAFATVPVREMLDPGRSDEYGMGKECVREC